MAKRRLTRVLGETSLERKCRIFFVCCLGLLIGGAFWGVERVAVNLVMKNTRDKGRNLVDIVLLRSHIDYWEDREEYKRLAVSLKADLGQHQDFKYQILALDEDDSPDRLKVSLPADSTEKFVIRQLQEKMKEQEQLQQQELESGNFDPVNAERRLPGKNEYHYFEPIY